MFSIILSEMGATMNDISSSITEFIGAFGTLLGVLGIKSGFTRYKQKKNGGTTYDYLVRIEKKMDGNHKVIYKKLGELDVRLTKVETKIDLYHGKKRGK